MATNMYASSFVALLGLKSVSGLSIRHASPSHSCAEFARNLDMSAFNTTILNSTQYAVGAYDLPSAQSGQNMTNAYAFCEVSAVVNYGDNDKLHFLTWLPDSIEYTDRFLAVGDGGFAGSVSTSDMLTDLNLGLGFAIAGGDAGHPVSSNGNITGSSGGVIPFMQDPDEVTAWLHNAISLFTPAAKAIVEAMYSNHIEHSYYAGCSTGGAQGFSLAQFHPELFDGIVAGSPGNWYSHLMLSFLWDSLQTSSNASMIPQAQLTAMTAAVLDKCDALDGVMDGLIENPLDCQFDIDSFACNATNSVLNSTTCLTTAQLGAAKSIYKGPTRPDTGAEIYPGFSFGSESSWLLQEGSLADDYAIPLIQNLVFDDVGYNARNFNFASDVDRVDHTASPRIDAISPDLSSFECKGGKILVTQGWADQFNAATWPIQHMSDIEKTTGHIDDWFKLFMVPGAGHCGANPAYPHVPATYATLAALVEWVENGHRPLQLLSTGPLDGSNTTRKLCPWPQTAHYIAGDKDDWASYRCKTTKK